MGQSGKGTNSSGKSYEWEVVGHGNREGTWHKSAPSDDAMRAHKADPEWQMLVEWKDTRTGAIDHFMIFGGYEPEDFGDIVDLEMENY